MNQRAEFVMQVRCGHESMSALCQRYGVSRKTGYKWLRRYEEQGSLYDLQDQSRRPHSSPTRTDEGLEALIIAERKKEYWGARKIKHLLAAEGYLVGESTINRVIKRNELVRKQDEHRPALRRFEHEAPNDLWQIDLKGAIRLEDDTACTPLTILDDHSRYLLGLFALQSATVEPIMACLEQVFAQFGLPTAILTDHGAPFWSSTNVHGLTKTHVLFEEQGIAHHLSGFRHPQTQGKVERLHLSLQQSMNHHGTPRTLAACAEHFAHFQQVYNHQRPHEALAMQVPATRYQPSGRALQNPAPAWLYPSYMTIRSLNTQGCLDYEGQRLFVCEALAQKQVGAFEFEGQLYVHYRRLPIRQVTLDSRRTRAPHA